MPSENNQAKIERLGPLQSEYPGFPGSTSPGRTNSIPRCLPPSSLGVSAARGIVLGPGRGVSRLFQGANFGGFFLPKIVVKSAIRHKGAWSHTNCDVDRAFERVN